MSNVAYSKDKKKKSSSEECTFCKQLDQDDDEKHYILKRTKLSVIMFNLYPYNSGHLMVLPLEHKGNLLDLTPETRQDLMESVNSSIKILKQELKPDGFNVGINLGEAGGGGMPSHLHIHVLPRWIGDTNFLPLIGETKPLSFDLAKMYKNLKKEFDKI
ncbi:HIT domain-containing protein [Candidatus Babeliales bacterium]|nr:HIT domain-containing protein [Candidatus Babeliales bacterium]